MDPSRSQKADVIRYTLQLCGNPPVGEVVMIGDRKYDVLGARENGLSAVGVLYGYGTQQELIDAGAEALAGSVDELRALLLGE